jgi:hypothetical protein
MKNKDIKYLYFFIKIEGTDNSMVVSRVNSVYP